VLRTTERQFEPQPASAAAARDFVGAAVTGTGVDRADAMLLTSELVSNAILHAHSDFAVRITIDDDDAVSVAVCNHTPELLPIAREPTATGGRGLALIEGIAQAWGFESSPDSKRVWFRLGRASTAE
jgi:anti-sigma regulatory factor (Ser/Thr protein kinase)